MERYVLSSQEYLAIDDILYKHGYGITPDELWYELRFVPGASDENAACYAIYDHDGRCYTSLEDMVRMLDEAMCDMNWEGLDQEEKQAWIGLLKRCGIEFRGGY